MTDSHIITLYWNRDEEAITASAEKYGAYCHAIAQRVLGSCQDAEECVNDTWFRAWGLIPPQKPRRLAQFLGRITRNLSFDRYRAATAEKRGGGILPLVLEELAECLPGSSDPEGEVEAGEMAEGINRFLNSLSPRECSVFLRRYFYCERSDEIAYRYEISVSNVNTMLSRTRKRLKAYLEQEGLL